MDRRAILLVASSLLVACATSGNGASGTPGEDASDDAGPVMDVTVSDATSADSAAPVEAGCTAGQTRCTEGGIESCSSAGQWGSASACDAQACVSGQCTGVCAPGQTQCSGNGVETCGPDGQWGSPAACTGSSCVGGACAGTCGPMQTQCSDGGVQTCDAGQWSPPTACSAQACVNGQCTGVCAPGQTQCSGNDLETCGPSGQWGTGVSCGMMTCVAGKCSGACVSGETQCSDGGVETCGASGEWGMTTPCTASTCVSGQCTGVCAEGATQCNGNGVETCGSGGQWGNPVACTNQTCLAGACTGMCAPGQSQCTGNSAQSCDATTGQWGTATSCGTQSCFDGQCQGVCSPGQTQCMGTALQGCSVSGQWQTTQTCAVACCNSTCVNTNTDPNNCGACGVACTTGYTCGEGFTAFTGTNPAGWTANGSATYDAVDNVGQLTDLNDSETGSWIYNHALLIDTATLQFDFYIGGGNGADGMGMMLQTNGATALGEGAAGLGISGLSGFGVEVDEYNNNACLDSNTNHIGIDALTQCGGGPPNTLTVNDSPGITVANATWHQMIVQIVNGAFTVTTDNINDFTSYTPSGWTSSNYYFGFGGGTGALYNYHRVRNVSVTYPTGHCY